MKTTLDLPNDLLREAKLRAVMQGSTLKDLITDFIRQGLGLGASKPADALAASSMVYTGPNGLPVVRCRADAPASRASLLELLALEQKTLAEEDLHHVGHPV